MRAKLWIMCGRAFSGKSTLAREIALQNGAPVVSLDEINLERGLISGDGLDVSAWIETTRIAHERVSSFLNKGQSVVVDDTNSLKFLRDAWRKIALECDSEFEIVWLPISIEEQQSRVRANRKTQSRADILDDVLKIHNDTFEEPTQEELARQNTL